MLNPSGFKRLVKDRQRFLQSPKDYHLKSTYLLDYVNVTFKIGRYLSKYFCRFRCLSEIANVIYTYSRQVTQRLQALLYSFVYRVYILYY